MTIVKKYWRHALITIAIVVIGYVSWPVLAAIFAGIAVTFSGLRSKKTESVDHVQSDMDSKILHGAIEENVNAADIDQALANRSGAKATVHRQAADDAKARLANLTPEERRAVVQRAKERLRRGAPKLIILASLLLPCAARADEPAKHPESGEFGWWFSGQELDEIDAWILELDERRQQVSEQSAQIASLSLVAQRMRIALMTSESLRIVTQRKLADSDANVKRLSAWYRSPKFIFPVALIGGALLATGAVYVAM